MQEPAVRFSIVSAVYNVAQYLPRFIASIEAQSFPLGRVEVIAVDDGSEDESLQLLKEWQARRPGMITVLQKENGGQGSARNLGLGVVHGEWVTFADPDDVLTADYLQVVDTFLRGHRELNLLATNRVFLIESTGELADRHPLRRFFTDDKVVDLDRFPNYFHSAGNAAFYKSEVIKNAALRFDIRIQPIFEDGHFTARYLLAAGQPLVGFVGSARYLYLRRTDGSSTVQTQLRHPGRFTAVPRYGYLDTLQRSGDELGRVPRWLQNMILYELSWYFEQDAAMSGVGTAARDATAREFIDLLGQIAHYLEPEVIESFNVRRFDREWREILLHAFSSDDWSTSYVVAQRYDEAKQSIRLAYRYVGRRPPETFYRRGQPVAIAHGKVRAHVYFEHLLMCERIAWVPADGTLSVELDGRPVEIRRMWPGRTATSMRPAELAALFGRDAARARSRRRRKSHAVRDALLIWLADSAPVRRVFRDAWVLMDRVHDGDDNAERLFRYLRRHRRRINAWFVIERDTPHWLRLKGEGYRRVVPHGTLRWRLLMLNCAQLISSHADVQVDRPPEIVSLRPPRWSFTFLQHGVIKDDLSRWLNAKKIALFVTTTPAEHESIVRDGSPYAFTSKEVRLLGMPRLDRLHELGSRVRPAERDLVLVCPTWRYWLNVRGVVDSHRRIVVEDFIDSDFAQQWLRFLTDPNLAALAAKNGLRVGFLPHPNIQPALTQLSLPPHVQPLTFVEQDVQDLIARSAVLVTDYSSMAFNAAYIERPVVYFQFDAHRYHSGAHVGRTGYFDYRQHGFGPVTESAEDAVAAVARAATTDGRRPTSTFRQRISDTFPQRDGHCCERVANAIEDLSRP